MVGVLFAVILAIPLVWASRRASRVGGNSVVALVLTAYGIRLILSLFLRQVPLFSHGLGGDCLTYEREGLAIARLWGYDYVHYVTSDELPILGRTSLPGNLFALVTYANDGPTPFGCTSVIAALACLSCLNIYSLAIEFGSTRRAAQLALGTLLFLPSFLYYTSDMYKDGIVQFCVVFIGGSALRLARRFSFKHIAVAAACLGALALTRFYLVYAMLPPLGLGILGLRSRSPIRTVVSVVAVCLGGLVLATTTDAADTFLGDANAAYELGTSKEVLEANAQGGSGVQLEGSTSSTFVQALAYTLFAPFPWQSGSIGFQLGKIDCLVWYVIAYYAAKGVVRLIKARRGEVTILLLFIVPTTLAYAAAFANVGLTVRERLGVVMICALLSAMGTATQGAVEGAVDSVGKQDESLRRAGEPIAS